jgi:deoxyguanosine kinase
MNSVFLCLGANLGNRAKTLDNCRILIEKHCGNIVKVSKIYETEAWGSSSENKFLNQVIKINSKYAIDSLLKKIHSIETELGRKRTQEKNADRNIDIDILFFNNEKINSKKIQVPHPRLHLRNFVLKPLLDIAGNHIHPISKKSIKQIYSGCSDKLAVKIYNKPLFICIEGNIGSGKTTLAKELAKELKAEWLPEQFEKNNLLPLFYENQKAFSFPLEYSFLLGRFQQLSDLFATSPKIVVSDFSFYKCLWFAKINLSKKHFTLFSKQFNLIKSQIPEPDIFVYLETDVKNLKKNIKNRGRSYEQGISEKYLSKITKQYRKGIKQLSDIDVLEISIKEYDNKLNKRLIKRIKKAIN